MVGFDRNSSGPDRPRRRIPVDERIAALAERQHGPVSRSQLQALGLNGNAIDYRVATRRLHPLHPGVYAVGHPSLQARGHWMAAVLASGPAAVLSHRDAAAHWGIRPSARKRIDVTVPGRTRTGHPGVDLHLVRRLDPDDRTTHDRIPVTTVARTLFDLAEVLSPQALERAFNEAEVLRLFDLRALRDVIHRTPGRHAHAPLRTLLSTLTDEPRITRSELERLFLDLVRKAGLPPPATNTHVAGHEVDAYWPGQCLVVELDGFAYHRTRRAFERDRERTEALQLAGLTVQPFTHRRISADPNGVAETVRRLLWL